MGAYLSLRLAADQGANVSPTVASNLSGAETAFRLNEIRSVNNPPSQDNLTTNQIITTANSRLNLLTQLFSFSSTLNSNANVNGTGSSGNGSKRQTKSSASDLINVTFSTHFYMTGKKIKNMANQAHSFLFGDQLDLSFVVSHKPVNVS
jgi:hypothetical protein